MKKIHILLAILLISFTLTSCNKFLSIDKARTEAFKALELTNDYNRNMKIIGKFGEGFVVSLEGNVDSMSTTIDGYSIPYSGMYTLWYIIDGISITLKKAYDLGYIAKEDLYTISERFKENKGKIETDYPLIDPYPRLDRCIHEPGDWKKVVVETCTTGGIEELYCKKCDKLLKTVEHLNIPHKYENGKCIVCGETEYEYVDTYDTYPSDMLGFYGTYTKEEDTKQGKCEITISVYGIEREKYHGNKNEGYNFYVSMETPQKRRKYDLDFVFVISNDTQMKVQYTKEYTSGVFSGKKETKLIDLDVAYKEGLINKNILIDVRNRIWKENKVGNYIYEHYEDEKSYRDYPKQIYLNYGEYIFNHNKIYEIFDYVTKNISELGSISFYNKYDDYYVGMAYNKLEYSEKETKVRVAGYKFEIEPYRELVVFNEDKIYDLKTAYRKGILTKDNIQEIYEIYLLKNK